MPLAPQSAAVITIKDASGMTVKGRQSVAKWLRNQASFLVEFGKDYTETYCSRFLYTPRSAAKRKKKPKKKRY